MPSLPTVLFVDDEPAHLRLCKTLLRKEWRVVTEESGAEGLARAALERPVIVVADHRMPGMTGTQMLERLRTRDPDCVRILLTAYRESDVMQEAINKAHVHRFFHKPLGAEELRLGLRRALEHRQALVELRSTRDLALLAGFCRLIAHDLNNVITPVMHAPTLLRDEDSSEEAIEILEDAVGSLAALTRELKAIAHGQIPRYDRRPEDILPILGKAITLTRNSGRPREFVVHQPAGELPVSMARSRCFRMFHNLLVNAVDATQDGGRIEVRVATEDGFVLIDVCDDGSGVQEDDSTHIFDQGFSTKGSSGLGLALSRLVAEGHDGSLELLPQDGGAAFRVRLPVHRP